MGWGPTWYWTTTFIFFILAKQTKLLFKNPRSVFVSFCFSKESILTWHCWGPQLTAMISETSFFSLRRTASSTAISQKGFIECLTPSVTTPELSGFTRTCKGGNLLGRYVRETQKQGAFWEYFQFFRAVFLNLSSFKTSGFKTSWIPPGWLGKFGSSVEFHTS